MPTYNQSSRSGTAIITLAAPEKPKKTADKQITVSELLGEVPSAPKTQSKSTKLKTPRKTSTPKKPSSIVSPPKHVGPHIITAEEGSPDGTVLLHFTIPGQPYTKKTSQRIFRGLIMPSQQYCDYEDRCEPHMLSFWVGDKHTPEEWRTLLATRREELQLKKEKFSGDSWLLAPNDWKTKEPMDYGVVLCMRIYLRNWQVGDCTGYQQSVADIIQKFGVISNDSWLHWDWEGGHWFGGIDKDNPRVEVTLKRFRHPKEAFRLNQEAEELAKQDRARLRTEKALAKTKNDKIEKKTHDS